MSTWTKLADLNTHETRIVSVCPRRRTYLRQQDAGYDWAAGREFVIMTEASPYYRSVVAIDEAHILKQYGYTHVQIHYNVNSAPLEIEL